MFLGMDLPGLNLPDPQKTYTMIGFVAWHIGTEIVLEIHAYRLSRKGNVFKKPCGQNHVRFSNIIGFLILTVDYYMVAHEQFLFS